MAKPGDPHNTEETAFDENLEEVIYHLVLEKESAEMLELLDRTGLEYECAVCGACAIWYTSEIQTEEGFDSDEGRVTRCWCDSCMPNPLIELWKTWPWTPDKELENYTPPSSTANNHTKTGLVNQENTLDLVCHLDLQDDSADVVDVLEHYDIDRTEATCSDCDQQATWYYAEIFDVSRSYDFGGARNNWFFCDSCIDSTLVDLWIRWPWTPDDELNPTSDDPH